MHVPIQKLKDIKEIGDHNPHISNKLLNRHPKGLYFFRRNEPKLNFQYLSRTKTELFNDWCHRDLDL